MCIFPLLIPLSTLSLVKINLVNPDDELAVGKLKKGPVNIPINMSTNSLSVKGGCNLPARSPFFSVFLEALVGTHGHTLQLHPSWRKINVILVLFVKGSN